MKRTLALTVVAVALAVVPVAFGADTSTLGVTVGPEASFTAMAASPSLTHSGTNFAAFGGTTTFTFKMRTTQTTGEGHISVAVAAFSGSSGLVIATDLAFTSTSASGTAYSSSAAADSTTAGPVADFGADAHSADAGDAGSVIWTLADRPAVKVGSYTAVATFTISAT